MARIAFHKKLQALHERLLAMAGLAEQTVHFALDAQSSGNLELCARVRSNESIINRSEREIDSMALDILAMEQPMAVDLRFILAAIKINSDLERIGDQSMAIAILAEELAQGAPRFFPVDIPRMAEFSIAMLRTALTALGNSDALLAADVLAMDDAVDEMNRQIKAVLLGCIAQEPESARSAVNLLLIARSLERIADHATNMAEDVIFWLSGADVRHGGALAARAV